MSDCLSQLEDHGKTEFSEEDEDVMNVAGNMFGGGVSSDIGWSVVSDKKL